MGEAGFWDKPEEAQKVATRMKALRRTVEEYEGRAQGYPQPPRAARTGRGRG
jgi:hypothetical protein